MGEPRPGMDRLPRGSSAGRARTPRTLDRARRRPRVVVRAPHQLPSRAR